jgi:WD40 repeat protein
VFDEEDEEQEDMSYIISVGWGRKIHIWADEKEEEVETTKILPQGDQSMGHNDDIMSAVYCLKNNLIYTGGHDGTLLAWNFETGYMKYQLHEYDKSCTSHNYIKDSKSVDMLLILNERSKLLSMTAD